MSDTPRTDAVQYELLDQDTYTSWLETTQFARQLERELNAAQDRIKRLKEALDECDWAFTKFRPEHESRYGDAWEKVRDALNLPNPFKPYWPEENQ